MPKITAKLMIEFLESLGFVMVRQRGSHKFFKHPDGSTATVPDHKGEDLVRGLTKKILNDAEATREEFLEWYWQS
ncbi:MAG: type II toxin-antitoxin system HicA family toxin [candidate division KSB1 bacterium]|nr:type II toxin-antitoxin system HicA family toxin [candidate division KSB1 bacterium]MDZ7366900.1 type II toxin-antitoxin system HicA family toxin [candidate division KSB1 bacterium]MDZ7406069.1 type II toxin-antitoxin system HicA family toxin [candidate division KSB1 bacterium]